MNSFRVCNKSLLPFDKKINNVYYPFLGNSNIFFSTLTEDKKKGKTLYWNIEEVQNELGPNIWRYLTLIHAFTGCDTTSRIDGLGKGTAMVTVSNL